MKSRSSGLALAATLVLCVPTFSQDPESVFHHAYFLEHARGHLQEALELYQRVAQSREAGAALQAEAQEHAAGLREELQSQDLAALMPPETLLYAELAHPADSLLTLLGQLGLTQSFEEAAAKGSFRVRPEMVRSLAGIRGVAVAITRLPEGDGPPGGVLIANAGEVEVLRGLVESGVLAAGAPEDAIQGWPAWVLGGHVHVAVGKRLIVASDDRAQIEAVLARAQDPQRPSLAGSPVLREELAKRDGTPLFVCVNAAPLRPMLAGLLASHKGDPAAAVLGSALDPDSLRALVARLNVGDDGLALDTELVLEKDHRNLVFNLMRKAPLDPTLLERIPKGAAGFVAGAFNQRGPAIAPLDRNSGGAPVVTLQDFGRELFANLAGFALFVQPGGAPIPSAALLLSSNDPERTNAVLGLVLGLVNVYSTGESVDGELDEIAGASTRVYRLPLGIPLYLTTQENTLILSPSEALIEAALECRGNGGSILRDEAFAAELGHLDKDATLACCVHLGRALEVAQPYLQAEQKREIQPFARVLTNTVIGLQTRHSGERLGLDLALHGLPRIDGLVGQALAQQRAQGSVVQVPRAATSAGANPVARLAVLATQGRDDEVRTAARAEMQRLQGDGRALNNLAWTLLTEEPFAGRFDDVALEGAEAANQAAHDVWQYVDTLALAKFRSGAVPEAIALEERALALVGAGSGRADIEASLARFRAAPEKLAHDDGPR